MPPLNPATSDLQMRATELCKSFDMVCLREKVEHLKGSHNITLLKEKSEITSQCWRMATDVKNLPWLKPGQRFQGGVADTRARWVNTTRSGEGPEKRRKKSNTGWRITSIEDRPQACAFASRSVAEPGCISTPYTSLKRWASGSVNNPTPA